MRDRKAKPENKWRDIHFGRGMGMHDQAVTGQINARRQVDVDLIGIVEKGTFDDRGRREELIAILAQPARREIAIFRKLRGRIGLRRRLGCPVAIGCQRAVGNLDPCISGKDLDLQRDQIIQRCDAARSDQFEGLQRVFKESVELFFGRGTLHLIDLRDLDQLIGIAKNIRRLGGGCHHDRPTGDCGLLNRDFGIAIIGIDGPDNAGCHIARDHRDQPPIARPSPARRDGCVRGHIDLGCRHHDVTGSSAHALGRQGHSSAVPTDIHLACGTDPQRSAIGEDIAAQRDRIGDQKRLAPVTRCIQNQPCCAQWIHGDRAARPDRHKPTRGGGGSGCDFQCWFQNG